MIGDSVFLSGSLETIKAVQRRILGLLALAMARLGMEITLEAGLGMMTLIDNMRTKIWEIFLVFVGTHIYSTLIMMR